MICEHSRTLLPRHGFATEFSKARAVENIVAQNEGRRTVAHELAANDERLRKTVRPRLLRIGNGNAEAASVAEEFGKERQVMRRRNNQNLGYPRHHEHT